MPDALIPPGYRAVLIGSALTVDEMGAFAPMEEGAAEGSLMLMQLDLVGFPASDALAELESKLRDAGVHSWPGNPFIVYADSARPAVYLAWQKGLAWLPVIIGILAVTVLPALLGGLIWILIPEPMKQTINMLINLGVMMLMIWLMTSLLKLLTAPERPKELKEARS
jgi:hypothetical protein